jgi:hypothetical protein
MFMIKWEGGSTHCKILASNLCIKHINIDALSHNPIDVVDEREDLIEEIQDCKLVGLNSTLAKTIWTR